jgi:hypothetical protein
VNNTLFGKPRWEIFVLAHLLGAYPLAKYIPSTSIALFIASSFFFLLTILLHINLRAGLAYFITFASCVILLSRLDLPPLFESIFTSIVSTLVWFRWSDIHCYPRVARSSRMIFSSILITYFFSFVQYGALIIGNSETRLRGNLLTYDLVAHSFLTKAVAICDSSIAVCEKTNPSIASNSYFNTYPDAFHLLFGNFFSQGLNSGIEQYLLTWGFVLFWSFALCINVLFCVYRNIGVETSSQEYSRVDLLFSKSNLLFFCLLIIAVVYPFNLGYLNFSYSIVLTIVSLFYFLKKNYLLASISLLVACEFWSFLYLITPLSFLILVRFLVHRRVRVAFSFCLFYAYYFGSFLLKSMGSDLQSSALLLGGTHVFEPMVAICLSLYVVGSVLRNPNLGHSRHASLFLGGMLVPFLILYIYLNLFLDVQGSYYLFKVSLIFLSLSLFIILMRKDQKSGSNSFLTQQRRIYNSFLNLGVIESVVKARIRKKYEVIEVELNEIKRRIASERDSRQLKKYINQSQDLVRKRKELLRKLGTDQELTISFTKRRFWSQRFFSSRKLMLRMSVIFVLSFWLIPLPQLPAMPPVTIPILSKLPQSPLKIINLRIPQSDLWSQQSKRILSAVKTAIPGEPNVLVEPGYWYFSTQWLNNLNFSWTASVQSEIDSLYQFQIENGLTSYDIFKNILNGKITVNSNYLIEK